MRDLGRLAIVCLLIMSCCVTSASARVGAEGVFVVVNERSWSSRTIANHFVRLNRIPASHVFSLDWGGSVISVSLDDFRQQLLAPILGEIQRRGLANQIDCIAYSSSFPYAVDFGEHLPAEQKDNFPVGSLTGLTTLYQQLAVPGAVFRSPQSNAYAGPAAGEFTPFSSQVGWTAEGQPDPLAQRRYLLSIMLGYVSGRGSSYEDVARFLSRSAYASSTMPTGTIYLMTNDDIRTKVRSPRFPGVVTALRKLKVNAEILQGTYPVKKPDVQGVVTGWPTFNWAKSRSHILPGAICDNLTSFGGVLNDKGGQLPLTRFLEHGAAGSSGTVVEPYALPQKFPDPFMHVYYALGSSLVESFYRATHSPYQILLIGDPICHPWGPSDRVVVDGFSDGDQVSGSLNLRPSLASGTPAEQYQLYINGRQLGQCQEGQQFVVDTRAFPDGYHEFRVVATFSDVARNTGRWIGWKEVQNQGHRCGVTVEGTPVVAWGDDVTLRLGGTPAMSYHAFYQRRELALPTSSDTLVIDSAQLGLGPNSLQIVGVAADGARVFAMPVSIYVRPPRLRPSGMRSEPRKLTLIKSDGTGSRLDTFRADWLRRAGVAVGHPFEIEGDLLAETTGVHQFQIYFAGRLSLFVDGSKALEVWHPKLERKEIPLNLSRGYHAIRIDATPANVKESELRFGFRGSPRLVAPEDEPAAN